MTPLPGFAPYTPPASTRTGMRIAGWVLLTFAALILGLILFGPGFAHAQEPGADPGDLVALALKAFSVSGAARWVALSLVGVLAATWAIRKFAVGRPGKAWAWVGSDEGGTVIGYVVSAAGSVAAHVLSGGSLSPASLGAVAVGLKVGSSWAWTDSRRILRVVTPLLRFVPGIGKQLGDLADALSGAKAKAEIAAATEAAYKAETHTAGDAAKILAAPPVQ